VTVDAPLEIKSSSVGQALRLELAGWLALDTIAQAEAAFLLVEASMPRVLIVDLSALEFLDSRGLRLILHSYHRIRRAGSRFILVRPRPPADRVLRITGVEQRLWAVEHLDEAVQLAAAADPQTGRGEREATRPLPDRATASRSPNSTGGAGA
jgi:anti-anti-sigma factor